MSYTDTSTAHLFSRLQLGWTPQHCGEAQAIVRLWKQRVGSPGDPETVGENVMSFTADLGGIRLRGLSETKCLLVTGDNAAPLEDAIRRFQRTALGIGQIPLVLALTDSAVAAAERVLPVGQRVILGMQVLRELLAASDPLSGIRQRILTQVSRRCLIPYSILRPAIGNMFYGRERELQYLREERGASFIIGGPSKMGKTSLVRQYRLALRHDRGDRRHASFYVDFYDCPNSSPDAVARHLAMGVAPGSRSDRMTCGDLLRFIRYQSSQAGGPLDLVLDEVDNVCLSEAFKTLGEAAKQGFCRLILCGRMLVTRMVLGRDSPLQGRLEYLLMGPLDPQPARRLVLEPLADLELTVENPDAVVARLFTLTGRLPQLVQFYAKRLAEEAELEQRSTVSLGSLEQLRWDFNTAQIFVNPIRDLTDPRSRQVALALLDCGQESFAVGQIPGLAKPSGVVLDADEALDVCNDLITNCVVVWDDGRLRLANGAMIHYARELGLLNGQATA